MGEGMRVFDLEQPRFEGMPIHVSHRPGYSYLLHRHHEDEYRPEDAGTRTSAAGIIVCMEHSGTHIDAICHQADGLELFGGIPVNREVQTPRGFTQLGIEEIPPIVANGVLLNVAASRNADVLELGYAVTVEDLEECCAKQETEIEAGDVVLIRTGNAHYWDDTDRYLDGPGMASGASYWLANKRVLAVGADNMAWDVIGETDPELGCTLPGHLILLARHGIYIIENLMLDELAAAGHYSFQFVCTPLKLVGATGSPVRPVAIISDEI